MFGYFHFIIRTFAIYGLFFVSPHALSNVNKAILTNTDLIEYEAHYIVYRKGDEAGTAVRALSKTNENLYKLMFKTNASKYFYAINTQEFSEFLYDSEHLKPIKYMGEDKRTFKKAKSQIIAFDYEKGRVLGDNAATQWSLPLEANVFDPLLVIEKLRFDIQNKIRKLEYLVYDKSSVKAYTFEHSGREIIQTSMGPIDTVKVSRVRKNSSRKTHFWLSVKHNFIPFRVEQEKEGKEVATLELDKLLMPTI